MANPELDGAPLEEACAGIESDQSAKTPVDGTNLRVLPEQLIRMFLGEAASEQVDVKTQGSSLTLAQTLGHVRELFADIKQDLEDLLRSQGGASNAAAPEKIDRAKFNPIELFIAHLFDSLRDK